VQTLTHIFGITLMGLIGVASVLGLIILVLCQVRLIVRLTGRIVPAERRPREFFPDAPSQRVFEDYWQN
jgi:Na+-transporting methylmalonyl-CoA/oxaloacetate decarboxylase gamma subunit